MVWLAGWEVTDGGTGGRTVRMAALLVTVPAAFVTVTVNDSPLFDRVVAGVVNEGSVAPLIWLPFFFH
jgi:hypothetical protein